jgi:hypothetical protein
MLELRPTCEHCRRDLPPASTEARICSFECTFCADCVRDVLEDACPNCGGGFVPRPVRPVHDWRGGNTLGGYPAGTRVVHRPVDPEAQRELLAALAGRPPAER